MALPQLQGLVPYPRAGIQLGKVRMACGMLQGWDMTQSAWCVGCGGVVL